ncbi:MAG: serine/threonine-protein kinase [Acidobacteriota bacterium]
MWSIAERFEVHLRLGAGGMGKVYLCRDRRAKGDGLVAVKVLREHGDGGDGYLEALIREFKILRHFEHPNIVRVLDAGTFKHAGRHRFWFSMEWSQGNNLLDYEWEDFPELGLIAGQVLSGLQAIHDAGFVHGDVKPQNILIGRIWSPREDSAGWRGHGRPVVKLLDFGLVMKARAREVLAGTPAYMAPEAMHQPERQSLSAQVGPASDLYSLGCVLYHVIARKLPYSGSDSEVQRKHADPAEWPAALAPRIPEYLRRLVERCMAKEPGARPQTASEVLSVLRENGMEELPATSRDSLAAFGMALNYVDPHGRAADLSRRIAGAMAGKGGPRTFYLDGPGGAGKSRLLREVKRLLAEDGVLVIRASGLDEGLHRIATKLAEACGSEMERQLFWRRHPHLTSRRPLSELPFDAIAENLAAAIRGVASRRRVVVAIDDAHHADRDVLHVLLLSARLLADHPVALLLLGDRAAAPGDVQETLAELAPPSAEVTGVATFDHRCVEDYLRAIFRAEPDGALTQYVLDASAGIPGAVATVVRHLHQTDEMVMGDGERVIALRSPVGDGGDVQEAVVSGLEAPERDVVEVLACLRDVPHEGRTGTELPAPAIAALARTTAAGVDGALQLLSSRGLAERVPTTGRHRIVSAARDVVLRTIPVEERRAIHRGIAEVLDGDDAIQLGRRARHLEKGGDATSASVAAMSAGKQLMERWKLSGHRPGGARHPVHDCGAVAGRRSPAVRGIHPQRGRAAAARAARGGRRLLPGGLGARVRRPRLRADAGAGAAAPRRRPHEPRVIAGGKRRPGGGALPLVLSQANLPEHRPVLDEVLVTRGRSLMRSERHDDAIAVLERLLELRREVTPARVGTVLIDLARCRAMAHPHTSSTPPPSSRRSCWRAPRGTARSRRPRKLHENLRNILVIPDRLAPLARHVNKASRSARGWETSGRGPLRSETCSTWRATQPIPGVARGSRTDLFDWRRADRERHDAEGPHLPRARPLLRGQYLPALGLADGRSSDRCARAAPA